MAPTYKLRYFDLAGRAEPIRMLLSYGNIPFKDERIARDEWPKVKPTTPLGQLPVLEIDGMPIPQSFSICRYLATIVNLAGKDAKENLAIDIAVETLVDLQKTAVEYVMEKDETKKQEKKKKFNEALIFYLEKLEKYAGKNGGYIALDRLTWADIIFLNTYENLMGINGTNTFDAYPALQKVKNNVLAQPTIENWIKNRPDGNGPMKPKYDLKQEI